MRLPAGSAHVHHDHDAGMTMDGIFYWTGKGLNWDVFGHAPGIADTNTKTVAVCTPDANGYFTSDPTAPNYYEWCGDHQKALEKNPTGQVASGGPVTLPDPNIVTQWQLVWRQPLLRWGSDRPCGRRDADSSRRHRGELAHR